MQPRNTLYRLMEPTDEPILQRMWTDHKKVFGLPKKFGFPTIVAERDGTILGFLSSDPSAKILTAGPLIVTAGVSGIVVMRLIEAYENLIRPMMDGYLFHVDNKNMYWMKMVQQFPLKQYEKSRTGRWFMREFR